MRWLPLAMLAWTLGGSGCGGSDCMKSSDIQVTVIPNPDVNPVGIATLHVTVRVGDAQATTHDFVPKHVISTDGSAFLLHPDSPPSSSYDLTVTVAAMDAVGTILAVGSDHEMVSTSGCNRLVAHLTSISFGGPGPVTGGDMSVVFNDMGMVVNPPDMGGNCIGGLPDEDNDFRANSCDICAADPEPSGPVDSDGDGLPDECDPNIDLTAPNKRLYFEPFDTNTGHWSTDDGVVLNTAKSFLDIPSSASLVVASSDSIDTLPVNVRMQTWFQTTNADTSDNGRPSNEVFSGLVLATNPDIFNTGVSGVVCRAHYFPNRRGSNQPDVVEVLMMTNGVEGPAKMSQLPNNFPFGKQSRLRLTQHGNTYTCEMYTPDNGPNQPQPATLTTATAPVAPQYMALENHNGDAHFYSVVAESVLP